MLTAFTYWMGASSVLGSDRDLYLKKTLEHARLGLDRGDPTGLAQMVIAATLMFQGHQDEALETINGLVIKRPACDVAYAVEGSVRRYMGEWEKSVDLLDKPCD